MSFAFGRKTESKSGKADKRDNQGGKDHLSDSSSSTNTSSNLKQQRQKEAMQKLASTFKKKTSERKQPDTWHALIQNLLHSQRGKLPLLLAVEAGNQSMVRELLSAQTAEQLRVSNFCIFLLTSGQSLPVAFPSKAKVNFLVASD